MNSSPRLAGARAQAYGVMVKRVRYLIRIGILAGYGAVLFVWLNYATHAPAWLPYRFWLLEG